ncbi:hypothetical protein NYA8BAC_02226 [Psychrobacter okhotskensis]
MSMVSDVDAVVILWLTYSQTILKRDGIADINFLSPLSTRAQQARKMDISSA